MNISLASKKIIVTGGSRGIGRALALGLADSGAEVVIFYSNSEAQAENVVEAAKGMIQPMKVDLANTKDISYQFKRAVDLLGGLDVLINNAGIAKAVPMDVEEDDFLKHWEDTFRVNTTAPALLSYLSVNHFTKHDQKGCLIHVSSRAAFRGDTTDFMAYGASKGALMSMNRTLARGFGKQGIVSFDLAPGFTKTDMAQDFIDQYGEDFVKSDLALNDITVAEDLVPIVVLMASGKMDHATGGTFHFNAASYVH
ncbi:MAG: SDR family oxidoreductase [Cyclobacteriaceae bacterium]|nr:SDR family oxidoreductase [Cyclobacteriaceae bacterium]MCH8515062.1 SDR family oxidoreductase [Cyclobacteriaceae bacterium]